jgi:CBS domain containing-hemolysin-like protein
VDFIKNNYYRVIITFFLLLLAYFSVSKLFDEYGEQYTDEGFQRSIVAFAIAKTLNGAISVVQGTEVAVEPAGIGLILTPGQILDPVNDLIERFSWVMLICTTSLGIQSVLLTIFSSSSFSIVVALCLSLTVLFLWKQASTSVVLKNILYRLATFLIILRFFIPVMAISSDGLYKAFLEPTYQESTQQLEQSNTAIANMSKDSQPISDETQEMSWFELLNNNINSAIDSINIDKQLERLKIEADNLTNHIIDLIVVFTMQTILFPLIFIWLAMKLIKVNFNFRFAE